MSNENTISRRGLFMKMGILFNGLVAAALAVPVVRFLLSSITRGRANAYLSWVSVGSVTEFPEGETRLATFRNPYVTPTDGTTVDTACWVRRVAERTIPGFCGQLRAPGLPRPLVSAIWLVHVSVPRRRVLPRRLACLRSAGARAVRISVQSRGGLVTIQAGELPTPGSPTASLVGKKPPCAA